jgi:N-acetylmuramoyl-L-alanine amidase CwlD
MRNKIFLMLVSALLVFCSAASAGEVKLTDVEVIQAGDYENIVISTTGWTGLDSYLAQNPARILINFKNLTADKLISLNNIESQRISRITTYQPQGKGQNASMVIYLKKPVEYEVVNLFGKDKIIIEVGDPRRPVEYAVKPEKKETPAETKTIIKPADETAIPEKTLPKQPVKPQKQILDGKVIVIDPGHGGQDPGGTSYHGVYEKKLTLELALKLEKMLTEAGAKVFMTRRADVTTDFRHIAALANRMGADIFIGIHFNTFRHPSISGSETYYFNSHSRRLAERVHRSVIKTLKRNDRKVRKEKVYVLINTNIPAIIVEPLYISNPQESKLAGDEHFQQKIAYAILQGIKDYYGK